MAGTDAGAGRGYRGTAAPPAVRSRAYYNAARLAMHLGRNERAEALAREALALAKQTGDEFEITHVLATLGSVALASGKEDEASAYYTESYAAAKRADDAGDARPIGLALLNLGELARKRGESHMPPRSWKKLSP